LQHGAVIMVVVNSDRADIHGIVPFTGKGFRGLP
jgi:hypothetical protein